MTKFSRKSINRAGEILVSDKATVEERENALQTLNDWRVLRLVPLNTFQITLRNYVKKTSGNDGIVAQRLKRIPTILDKLKRQPQMQLARMQDIGGLRAIVPTVQNVRDLEKYYKKYCPKDKSKQHILKRQYDYIIEPKESGYRGIHFVYEYCSPQEEYNGLQIEIQLRSRLQHLWATAVETVGFFFQESLKSSQGNQNWLNFFKLVGAAFALEEKELPHCDFQSFTSEQLAEQLRQYNQEHRIVHQLETIRATNWAKRQPQLANASYWVIETTLNGHSQIVFHSFMKSQSETADSYYRLLEQSPDCQSGKKQVVLVSVDSVSKIEKAYPNFFGEIEDFINALHTIIQPH